MNLLILLLSHPHFAFVILPQTSWQGNTFFEHNISKSYSNFDRRKKESTKEDFNNSSFLNKSGRRNNELCAQVSRLRFESTELFPVSREEMSSGDKRKWNSAIFNKRTFILASLLLFLPFNHSDIFFWTKFEEFLFIKVDLKDLSYQCNVSKGCCRLEENGGRIF